MLDDKLFDESARLAALRRYDVLDTPPEEPFDKITSLVQSILSVPICAVSLVDEKRQWFKSSQGLDAKESARDVSFCTHTVAQRTSLIIRDALADPRFAGNPLVVGSPFIRSYAGVPLSTPDGYNIGALCAIDTAPRAFDPNHIAILERFGALVVDELELRQVAQRDFLTGVLSRRAFANEVERKIALYQRHGRTSALITFDIDHFKSVNDRFGHPAGDKVLAEVAERASAELRGEDCIGRLGGEEFGILVAETSGEGATKFAERVRASLASTPVDLGELLTVTASFGVASVTVSQANPHDWFAAADAALYKAKENGRNCTVRHCQASMMDHV